MNMIIYGIKNCDTVKKSLVWFNEHDAEFTFHDFKKAGLDKKTLVTWNKQCGLEKLINRKGTTYRGLTDAEKTLLEKDSTAFPIILEKPTLLRRPIIEVDGKVVALGFDVSGFEEAVKA